VLLGSRAGDGGIATFQGLVDEKATEPPNEDGEDSGGGALEVVVLSVDVALWWRAARAALLAEMLSGCLP
jgi:hypothetical protein